MHGSSSKAAGVKQPSPRQAGPSPALTRARKLQAAKDSHTTGKAGIPTPTSRPLNRAAPVSSGRTAKSGTTPSSLKPVVLTTTCSKAAMLSSPQQEVHDSEEGSTTSSSTSSPSSSSSWEHETPPSSPSTGTDSEKEDTASPKPKKLAATGSRPWALQAFLLTPPQRRPATKHSARLSNPPLPKPRGKKKGKPKRKQERAPRPVSSQVVAEVNAPSSADTTGAHR
ncbi:hypothetical protein MRX96_032056 [Rhipicephalus microplus]